MHTRHIAMACTLAAGVVLGQEPSLPRTSQGRPDLHGVWDFSTLTPLQRPVQFAGTPTLTRDQAAAFVERTLADLNTDRPLPAGPVDVRTFSRFAMNEFWWERAQGVAIVHGRLLSSLVIDPPDGRIPALTAEAEQKRLNQERVMQGNIADHPEQRLLTERCLASHAGPPIVPGGESDFVLIVQTGDHVVIAPERSNDARVIPLAGSPRPRPSSPTWQGDPVGSWQNDVLVIESVQLRGVLPVGGRIETSTSTQLTERLTLTDADTLLYEFTVNDPGTFMRPWTAVVPMRRSVSRMFEYACHEGNYGLEGILRGARAEERRGPRR